MRWEWALAGDDWSVWDDLVGRPGRAHGILLGTSAAYQYRAQEPMVMEIRSAAQANVDLSFNGDGYQAMVAGSATWRDPEGMESSTSYGLLAQAGVFVAENQQVYTQYNFLSPCDAPGNLENFDSLAVGYSFFPFDWTNRWKFSAEVGHLFGSLNQTVVGASGALGWLPSDEDHQTYLKFQAQIGF